METDLNEIYNSETGRLRRTSAVEAVRSGLLAHIINSGKLVDLCLPWEDTFDSENTYSRYNVGLRRELIKDYLSCKFANTIDDETLDILTVKMDKSFLNSYRKVEKDIQQLDIDEAHKQLAEQISSKIGRTTYSLLVATVTLMILSGALASCDSSDSKDSKRKPSSTPQEINYSLPPEEGQFSLPNTPYPGINPENASEDLGTEATQEETFPNNASSSQEPADQDYLALTHPTTTGTGIDLDDPQDPDTSGPEPPDKEETNEDSEEPSGTSADVEKEPNIIPPQENKLIREDWQRNCEEELSESETEPPIDDQAARQIIQKQFQSSAETLTIPACMTTTGVELPISISYIDRHSTDHIDSLIELFQETNKALGPYTNANYVSVTDIPYVQLPYNITVNLPTGTGEVYNMAPYLVNLPENWGAFNLQNNQDKFIDFNLQPELEDSKVSFTQGIASQFEAQDIAVGYNLEQQEYIVTISETGQTVPLSEFVKITNRWVEPFMVNLVVEGQNYQFEWEPGQPLFVMLRGAGIPQGDNAGIYWKIAATFADEYPDLFAFDSEQ